MKKISQTCILLENNSTGLYWYGDFLCAFSKVLVLFGNGLHRILLSRDKITLEFTWSIGGPL